MTILFFVWSLFGMAAADGGDVNQMTDESRSFTSIIR